MDSPALAQNGVLQEEPLRLLIRQELFQGLRGLSSELQESLRHVVHDELLPVLPMSRSKSEVTQQDPKPEFQQRLGSIAEPVDALRQSAFAVPPGAIAPEAGSQPLHAKEVCACGNIYLDDALFCRKCGAARPNVCTCGNIFKDDAVFCRKCGISRAAATNAGDGMHPHAAEGRKRLGTKDPKKAKKQKTALFKPKQVECTDTQLQRFTKHKYYEVFSFTLILVNSIFLAYQIQFIAETYIDNSARNEPLRDPPAAFFAFHCIFCVFFTVELGLRWRAEGLIHFFNTEDVWWNILDLIVVVSSMLEVIFEVIAHTTNTEKTDALQSVSVVRVLRIVRIVRVARVIRVMRFFRELRMMLFSILGCMKNLVWVLIILALTFFMFGVGFTSATCDYLDTTAKWQDADNDDLVASFGKIDNSILSLFMAMSGGNDWGAYYEPLLVLPIWYRFGFLLFIAFSVFAVVNIVTGVFVESALQANIKDRDIIVHEELEAKQEYLQSMQDLFEEMDEDDAGTISIAEFEDKLKDVRVIAYFNALKLDVSDARTVFKLLDHDRSGEIGIDEFLLGCYKLQGESRSLDMKIMQYEVQFLQEHFASFEKSMVEMLTSVRRQKPEAKQPEDCELEDV